MDLRKKIFFFQAEDGIRDQPRSRGLGDVYKRQPEKRIANNIVIITFYSVYLCNLNMTQTLCKKSMTV